MFAPAIEVARDSIEALYVESRSPRRLESVFDSIEATYVESSGSGPFFGDPAEERDVGVPSPRELWERTQSYCFGPGPHRDGPANPYGVFLDAGCHTFPYFQDGKEMRGDGQYQTICLDSDNVHG